MTTDLPVGEILRRERLRYNLTLPQVEQDLKIRLKILEALETGNYTNITGGKPYVIGHTRTYAEYLRLDGDRVIELLKSQMGGQGNRRPPAMVMPVAANDSAVPDKRLLGLSVAVLAVVILGGALLSSLRGEENIPTVPEALKQPLTLNEQPKQPRLAQQTAQQAAAITPAAGVTAPPLPAGQPQQPMLPASAVASASPSTAADNVAAAPMPIYADPSLANGATPAAVNAQPATKTQTETVQATAADTPPLVMKALQDSWMEVRTGDGRVVYSGLLKSGKSLVLREDRDDLKLTTGNAGGIEIYVDGQAIPRLGNIGEVKKDVRLDPDQLRNRG